MGQRGNGIIGCLGGACRRFLGGGLVGALREGGDVLGVSVTSVRGTQEPGRPVEFRGELSVLWAPHRDFSDPWRKLRLFGNRNVLEGGTTRLSPVERNGEASTHGIGPHAPPGRPSLSLNRLQRPSSGRGTRVSFGLGLERLGGRDSNSCLAPRVVLDAWWSSTCRRSLQRSHR